MTKYFLLKTGCSLNAKFKRTLNYLKTKNWQCILYCNEDQITEWHKRKTPSWMHWKQTPAIILNKIEMNKFINQNRTIYRSVSSLWSLTCIEYLDIMSVFINKYFSILLIFRNKSIYGVYRGKFRKMIAISIFSVLIFGSR